MIIATSNLKLAGYHQQSSFVAVEERLRAWTGGGDDTVETRRSAADSDAANMETATASFDFEQELETVSIEASRSKLRTPK